MCDVLRKVWWLVESLLMWFHVCVVVNYAMLWKWSSPHYLCEHVICIILRHGCESVMCLEKEWELKEDVQFRGTYRAPRWILYFDGRITHRDGYYYRGSCRAPRQMHGQICAHGSRTERQRVCITRSDMHHYNWHCIPLHCTYLSLVNLILCFVDLVVAFLRNLWLLNYELAFEDI